ncbi:peptide deformylase [uncultured Dokdonia sp.]|uniref:peptide deformylase n=1 Tax=uncultured Dokdonia sp. TaxID=575653 RepID=UPI002638D7BA|nr:peptide deformylase [uncultured Dokdonia sp.]
MAVLDVLKMGNPLLRKTSIAVGNELHTLDFQKAIDAMIDTMRFTNGVGIAAPQVGILKRVFLMENFENPRYPEKNSFPLYIAINPEIEVLDDTLVDSWEGCLSIPAIRGKLKRCKSVVLKAIDRDGNPFQETLEGFASIVAQHELDHLNGILLIDRMDSMETLTFQEEYEKYWI